MESGRSVTIGHFDEWISWGDFTFLFDQIAILTFSYFEAEVNECWVLFVAGYKYSIQWLCSFANCLPSVLIHLWILWSLLWKLNYFQLTFAEVWNFTVENNICRENVRASNPLLFSRVWNAARFYDIDICVFHNWHWKFILFCETFLGSIDT